MMNFEQGHSICSNAHTVHNASIARAGRPATDISALCTKTVLGNDSHETNDSLIQCILQLRELASQTSAYVNSCKVRVCIVVSWIACMVIAVLCILWSPYVYLYCVLCICCTVGIDVFTLDAGLLARSQYSEGHLDTGFSWFPCVFKQNAEMVPNTLSCHYMLHM
jgi:hypothetical protein